MRANWLVFSRSQKKMSDDACEEKRVLAHFLEHTRPVKFSGGKEELGSAVPQGREYHALFLKKALSTPFQIMDEEWGGVFVYLVDQKIVNRGQTKVVVLPAATNASPKSPVRPQLQQFCQGTF